MEIDKFLELIKPYEFQIETLSKQIKGYQSTIKSCQDRYDSLCELNKDVPGFRKSKGCSLNILSRNLEPTDARKPCCELSYNKEVLLIAGINPHQDFILDEDGVITDIIGEHKNCYFLHKLCSIVGIEAEGNSKGQTKKVNISFDINDEYKKQSYKNLVNMIQKLPDTLCLILKDRGGVWRLLPRAILKNSINNMSDLDQAFLLFKPYEEVDSLPVSLLYMEQILNYNENK